MQSLFTPTTIGSGMVISKQELWYEMQLPAKKDCSTCADWKQNRCQSNMQMTCQPPKELLEARCKAAADVIAAMYDIDIPPEKYLEHGGTLRNTALEAKTATYGRRSMWVWNGTK